MLTAGRFDPALVLLGPAGDVLAETYDYLGAVPHARLESDLQTSGEYRVVVTSFAPAMGGLYELRVDAR